MNIETIRFLGPVTEYLRRFFCGEATPARLSGISTRQLHAQSPIRIQISRSTACRPHHRRPLPGLSHQDGSFDEVSYATGFDDVWAHFLAGTFSLCVRDATDESRIAEKEALKMRLSFATVNGTNKQYTRAKKHAIPALIERFVEVSMPFSPIEYGRSTRHRLVENILPHLQRIK